MEGGLTLFGYRHSVYTWIARLTLRAVGASWRDAEANPFAGDETHHPFGRVPVLDHDGYRLYETRAICAYVDAVWGQGRLTPQRAQAMARADQAIALIDAYGYGPMVRQVFAHSVFRPWAGEPSDAEVMAQGLSAARPVLAALEEICAEGLVLTGKDLTRADCHLAPMMAYFTATPQGVAALSDHPALASWWDRAQRLRPVQDTWPDGPVQRP